MRHLLAIGVVLSTLLACSDQVNLEPGIAARVGGRDIAYAEFTDYLNRTAGDAMDLQTAAIATLFESFLEEELLFSLALDRDLLTDGADRALAGSLLLASVDGLEVSDAEVEAHYREHRDEFRRDDRVRLQQILVQERDLAERAWQELENGTPWSTVAARLERDHGAVVGSQGEISREEMPLAFVEPVFALAPGENSAVVEAEYGYHVFMVEARQPAGIAPLDAVREDIRRKLATEKSDSALQELLATAKQRYTVLVADQNLPFERSDS